MTHSDHENAKVIEFGRYSIDQHWRLCLDNIPITKGHRTVAALPVRILAVVICKGGMTVRADDLRAFLSPRDLETRTKHYRNYMSTVRTAMKRGDFNRYFRTVNKSRGQKGESGGYCFPGSARFSEPIPNIIARAMSIPSKSSPAMSERSVPLNPRKYASGRKPVEEIAGTELNTVNSEFASALPDKDTLNFARAFNAQRRKSGAVIETHPHPHFRNGMQMREVGWASNEISLRLRDESFDASAILADPLTIEAFEASERKRLAAGKGSSLEGDNNRKYTIVDASSPFHDVSSIAITLAETDYFTMMRCRPGIQNHHELRVRYGHVIPSQTQVPTSTCVAFIAIFTDGTILAIKRAGDTFQWPGTWSFSGEEQLSRFDLSWKEPVRMEQFLYRAVYEELFPARGIFDHEQFLREVDVIAPYVQSMRTWSLFIEVPTMTLQFLSVIEMALSSTEYSELVYSLIQKGNGSFSHEGEYYFVKLTDISDLLSGHTIIVSPLVSGDYAEIAPSQLHPTSRYRLLRLCEYFDKQ